MWDGAVGTSDGTRPAAIKVSVLPAALHVPGALVRLIGREALRL